jgi:hypothetical protein
MPADIQAQKAKLAKVREGKKKKAIFNDALAELIQKEQLWDKVDPVVQQLDVIPDHSGEITRILGELETVNAQLTAALGTGAPPQGPQAAPLFF